MADLYHISDEAYGHLVELAVQHNFVRENAIRNSGISRFIERLSFRTLVDDRPDDIKVADDARLSSRRVPYWNMGHLRKARTLDLSEEALFRYVQTAMELKIWLGPYYKGGPFSKSQTAITSAVLEAIGINWARPLSYPQELGDPKKPILRGARF